MSAGMTLAERDAWYNGFVYGEDDAIHCCFGGTKMAYMPYDTDAEQSAYEAGIEAGRASVD